MPKLSLFQNGQTNSLAKSKDEPRGALDIAGHLLTDTAHDLRSPLAAARELTQLVADGIDGPVSIEQKEHLHAVVDRCNDMQRLIDDMLHFECVRTGSPRIAKDWIAASSLPSLVQPLVEMNRRSRHVGLQWVGFEADLPRMFADADKVKRLLVNLIDNAIRATPESGQITVRTELARTGDRIRLSVEDAGAGIAPQQWQTLSQRGVSHQQGHGLGLSICRQIAALHFTQLAVESQSGQGSKFSLELPVGGPAAVVDSFARWRETILPTHPFGSEVRPPIGKRIRPMRRPSASRHQQKVLPAEASMPRYSRSVAMVEVSAALPLPGEPAKALDQFLQSQCEMHELVYPLDSSQWIMLLDNNVGEAEQRIATIDKARIQAADNFSAKRSLQWSSPLPLAVGTPADRVKLHEAFDRSHLDSNGLWRTDTPGSSVSSIIAPEPTGNPGAAVAQQRLESEVRWLTQKFRNRQKQLHSQIDSLRHPS